MTTFDTRDKAFENKFAHDEEIHFKATALCNRLLGQWAATQMGKSESQAEAYAVSIIEAEFGTGGHKALEAKILGDLTNAGIPITIKDLHKELARLMPIARKHVMGVQD